MKLNLEQLEKLSKKLGKNIKYVREQVCKRATKEKVSSPAYLIHWLSFLGVSTGRYLNNVAPEVKGDVHVLQDRFFPGIHQNTKKNTTVVRENILHIKELKITEKEPILTKGNIKDAKENAYSYQVLFIFENSLRNFMVFVLAKKYGDNWWNHKNVNIKNEIKNNVASRQKKEEINPWLAGKRGVHPIHYTDFSDIANILRSNVKNFDQYFIGLPNKMNWLTQKLDELYFARNNIAHAAPLKTHDRDMLELYFKHWSRMIRKLNKEIQ